MWRDDESTTVERAAEGRRKGGEVAIRVGMDDLRMAPHRLADHGRSDYTEPIRCFEQFPDPGAGDWERIGPRVRPHPSERSAAKQVGREDLDLVTASAKTKR